MASSVKPLIISEQPPSLFWKDRGGKRNMLRVVVESPIPLRQSLPLRIMLFNDAGEAVEEVRVALVTHTLLVASSCEASLSVMLP